MSLSVLMLCGYYQQLVTGYRLQWAQRDAGWAATQGLAGKPADGWLTDIRREPTSEGCLKVSVGVRGAFNRQSTLTQLFCPPFNDSLPE